METASGYVICATPRTGSTFLCRLLSATHVLGRPESYFREPDEVLWSQRFGLRTEGDRVHDYRQFAGAAREAATTPNGVFAARIMWGAIPRIRRGLDGEPSRSDREALEEAFGPLHFVHLQRSDVIGQAVSWARAEQTGYWQQGDRLQRMPEPDIDQMLQIVGAIRADNAAWRSWYDLNEIEPHEVEYADLTTNPGTVLGGIAALSGLTQLPVWRSEELPQRQADSVNAQWSALLRDALARHDY